MRFVLILLSLDTRKLYLTHLMQDQIINFTFPHIGNVGTNKEDCESDKIWTKGVIFNSEITSPSNYRSFLNLDAVA